MSQDKTNFILKDVLFSAVASGIKTDGQLDLAVILLPKQSKTAGVFTQNIFYAAPVLVAKNHLNHHIRAFIINSGNANAGTGISSNSQGLNNAYKVCELLADVYGITPEQVLPFSTGVIGEQLPMNCFNNHIKALVSQADNTKLEQVAQAIMTTDTQVKIVHKTITYQGKTANIIGIAKGSGMICPNMATMLSFIITDLIAESREQLQDLLTQTVNQSFNRITIDGDTSTNDAVTLSATGTSGITISQVKSQLTKQLNEVSQSLAMKIIQDGEGATKFVEICVSGGASQDDCLQVAYTVAHSPLVKTALFACDANIGRLLMAVGRAKVTHPFAQHEVNIKLNTLPIITDGVVDKLYTEQQGSLKMKQAKIVIEISIGNSQLTERVWTTDFSYDYIKINAEYRS